MLHTGVGAGLKVRLCIIHSVLEFFSGWWFYYFYKKSFLNASFRDKKKTMNKLFLINEANLEILEILLGNKIFCGHVPPLHNRLVLSY